MYVGVCGCVRVFVSVCRCVWVFVIACRWVRVFVSACGCMWMYVSVCECMWVYVCGCECMWVGVGGCTELRVDHLQGQCKDASICSSARTRMLVCIKCAFRKGVISVCRIIGFC